MDKVALIVAAMPVLMGAGFGPLVALQAAEHGQRFHAAAFALAAVGGWFLIITRGLETVALLNA